MLLVILSVTEVIVPSYHAEFVLVRRLSVSGHHAAYTSSPT